MASISKSKFLHLQICNTQKNYNSKNCLWIFSWRIIQGLKLFYLCTFCVKLSLKASYSYSEQITTPWIDFVFNKSEWKYTVIRNDWVLLLFFFFSEDSDKIVLKRFSLSSHVSSLLFSTLWMKIPLTSLVRSSS